jgi:hypothetical protein
MQSFWLFLGSKVVTFATFDDPVLVLRYKFPLDRYGAQPIAIFLKRLTSLFFSYIIYVANNQIDRWKTQQLRIK